MAKKTVSAAYKDWEQFRINLYNETVVEIEDISTKEKRISRLIKHPEEFFKYYFPNYYTSDAADFQKRSTKRILKNKDWYEVKAWARSLAKSARTMMEVIYLSLTGEIKNVLLISHSADQAEELLQPFKINFESNQRIINDFGDQQSYASWSSSEFITKIGCAFKSIGAGQSPRGTRHEAVRPDCIIFDDIDTDEEVRSAERVEKKWEWIEDAAMGTIDPSVGARIIFNGNIIGEDTCITRAMEKADHGEIVNIRDKNDKSTWPQKNTEAVIDRLFEKRSRDSILREYFNIPRVKGTVLKNWKWGQIPPLNKFKFLIIYGDPSPSNNKENKKSSKKAVFLMGIINEILYVIYGFLDNETNDEFVNWYYNVDAYVNKKTTVYKYIENNSLQDPFYTQVIRPAFAEKAKKSYSIGLLPDDRKKPEKYSRLENALEPLDRVGHIIFNEKEKNNPNFKELKTQYERFRAEMTYPADGLDCIEGGYWILNNKLMVLRGINTKNDTRANKNKNRM